VVDLEADLNASISLGVRPGNARPSIFDVLLRQQRASDAIRPVRGVPNLFLITGCGRLTQIDASLRNVRDPERRLADTINPLEPQFDAIVLDSPAGFSQLARSVPVTAGH